MYVASWSGGKDSTATIILAHEHGEPLDKIIFSEVMFDKEISGELPEHIEFIHNCIPLFESWGYPVEILRSDETYLYWFYKKITRAKTKSRNGMLNGFPLPKMCVINGRCKVKPIKDFDKNNPDVVHYVGIAIDEPKRLKRCNDKKNHFWQNITTQSRWRMNYAKNINCCRLYIASQSVAVAGFARIAPTFNSDI